MSELSLGQFIKNVFDYSTGKPVQQQPGKVANENFQRAQNEAMKMVQQTNRQNRLRQQIRKSRKRKGCTEIMKKYADRTENLQYQKYETVNDMLKARFLKAYNYERALKEEKEHALN